MTSVFKDPSDEIIVNTKCVLVNWNKYRPPYGCRSGDELFNKLQENPSVIFMDFDSPQDTINFINTNKSHYLSLIFPMAAQKNENILVIKQIWAEEIIYLNYIKTLSDTNMKFYFIPQDVFGNPLNYTMLQTLCSLQSNSIRIILSITDLEDYFDNVGDFSKPYPHFRGKMHPLKNPNDALFWTVNYAYGKSFMPFNENPIIKIALSGHRCEIAYPDRFIIEQKLNKYPALYERIPPNRGESFPKNNSDETNIFSIKLNKYFANIYTCVYNYKKSIPLLKLFEILASGSLLIIPLDHQLTCNKLNLIENEHYKVINFDDESNMLNTINYILSPDNRTEMDTIRRQGQDFCKENLNADWCYNNFIKLFNI